MMRMNFRALTLLLLLFGLLSSCKKSAEGSIAGTWNLQRQHTVILVNGSKQTDTTYNASADAVATLQFNPDHSYNSQTLIYGVQLGVRSVTASASVNGTYSSIGGTYTISNGVTGLGLAVTWLSGQPPVVHVTSDTEKIDGINAGSFTLHADITAIYTLGSSTETHRTVTDYYYSR